MRWLGRIAERARALRGRDDAEALMRAASMPLLELALLGSRLARATDSLDADDELLRDQRELAIVTAALLRRALDAYGQRFRDPSERWERRAANVRSAAVSDHLGALPPALGARASLELLLALSAIRGDRRAVPAHLATAIGLLDALAALAAVLRDDARVD